MVSVVGVGVKGSFPLAVFPYGVMVSALSGGVPSALVPAERTVLIFKYNGKGGIGPSRLNLLHSDSSVKLT